MRSLTLLTVLAFTVPVLSAQQTPAKADDAPVASTTQATMQVTAAEPATGQKTDAADSPAVSTAKPDTKPDTKLSKTDA
ncbi:MAG: hypothetical protein ABI142_00225, partial [Bryocella sp.]